MTTDDPRFLGRPVHSLQAMLRELSYHYPKLPRLVSDGIFGEETLEAVMIFQREFQLPVTGKVDNKTWDAVVLAYARVSSTLENPLRANGFPDRLYTISPGERCVYLLIIQAMFNALSSVLEEVEPTPVDGSHTGPSVNNICWLQRKGQMEETGVIGKYEWNLLSRIYEVFLIRTNEPNPCHLLKEYPSTARKSLLDPATL
ncbi:peptidoglycan-binding domain-containing protein [Pseudoflavonifractor phocaeensis]|uniref:peptidoglycan-binding domain-containing protein n=1 Tax=Pseudoflavonifractor phocaeensis TaxID=1870988 RepID=UPI00313D3F9C